LIDIAESKDVFLAQIEAYEANERVRRVFDFAQVRRLVAMFPSPEQVREEMRGNDNPKATAAMITVAQMLATAAYIDQHGCDEAVPTDRSK
jgi:hypothetical protein